VRVLFVFADHADAAPELAIFSDNTSFRNPAAEQSEGS
jgi:hypothetical protein